MSVIIYTDNWPKAMVLNEIFYDKKILYTNIEKVLFDYIKKSPSSLVILGIRPHEHISMLFTINLLPKSVKTIIINDSFYWLDRLLTDLFTGGHYLHWERLLPFINGEVKKLSDDEIKPIIRSTEGYNGAFNYFNKKLNNNFPDTLPFNLLEFVRRIVNYSLIYDAKLTLREYSIIQSTVNGMTAGDIASEMGIKRSTVYCFRTLALQKLSMNNTTDVWLRGIFPVYKLQKTHYIF
ncbi:hypothetical protein IO249_003423 [Salmonella enterica]|nr:hypothetical protein [Salmonella enterica]